MRRTVRNPFGCVPMCAGRRTPKWLSFGRPKLVFVLLVFLVNRPTKGASKNNLISEWLSEESEAEMVDKKPSLRGRGVADLIGGPRRRPAHSLQRKHTGTVAYPGRSSKEPWKSGVYNVGAKCGSLKSSVAWIAEKTMGPRSTIAGVACSSLPYGERSAIVWLNSTLAFRYEFGMTTCM